MIEQADIDSNEFAIQTARAETSSRMHGPQAQYRGQADVQFLGCGVPNSLG